MGEGVQRFDDRLMIGAPGWGEHDAQDEVRQTDHALHRPSGR